MSTPDTPDSPHASAPTPTSPRKALRRPLSAAAASALRIEVMQRAWFLLRGQTSKAEAV